VSVFISPDTLATNPTMAVMGFRRQIIYHLHLWALVAVAPLVVVQWQAEHLALSVLLALFCINAVLVVLLLRKRDIYFLGGRLFPILAVICAAYSTYINGHAGLYWAYPAAIALFFLLPLKEAVACNVVFIGTMALVSFLKFPLGDVWRITFSLGFSCLFSLIFAWMVGNLKRELTRLATTDPLTGCLNRSQLCDILNSHIKIRERHERVASMVLIDLDYFKSINDDWGHLVGDQVLKEMAQRLQERLRDSDQMFRIGGEEFMLVLPETRRREAEALAQQLLLNISERPFLNDIPVTASASVAEVRSDETWSTWLNRADQALYAAKAGGRNQVVNAAGDPDMAKPRKLP